MRSSSFPRLIESVCAASVLGSSSFSGENCRCISNPNLLLSNTGRPLAGRWVVTVSVLVGNQLQSDVASRGTDFITPLGVFGNQTPPTAEVNQPRFSPAGQFPRLALAYVLMNILVAPSRRLSVKIP